MKDLILDISEWALPFMCLLAATVVLTWIMKLWCKAVDRLTGEREQQ